MHLRLFNNTFIADLSGKWKLSRVLTPFVTGPKDAKSIRIIGTVFNVLYCLAIIIVCYLTYLNKGKTGLVIAFFIFAVCGAICQAISIRIKKKAGRPSSSVKSLEACFKNRETYELFRNYVKGYLQTHKTLDGSFVYTAYEYFNHAKLFSVGLNSTERFSKIMDSEFPLSYTDHQNIYARSHLDDLWKDLEKLEK